MTVDIVPPETMDNTTGDPDMLPAPQRPGQGHAGTVPDLQVGAMLDLPPNSVPEGLHAYPLTVAGDTGPVDKFIIIDDAAPLPPAVVEDITQRAVSAFRDAHTPPTRADALWVLSDEIKTLTGQWVAVVFTSESRDADGEVEPPWGFVARTDARSINAAGLDSEQAAVAAAQEWLNEHGGGLVTVAAADSENHPTE